MLNYDVGWIDETGAVSQSIEVEGQDDLSSHAPQSSTLPVKATKTKKGRKRNATLSTEVEEQDEPVIHTDNDATEATNVSLTATKARKRRKRTISHSIVEEVQDYSALPADPDEVHTTKVSPEFKARKRRKRVVSPSVEEGGQEDSALPTDSSSALGAKVSPVIKVKKGTKRAKVDAEGVVEPIVWRDSSSKRSFKWTPEQVKTLTMLLIVCEFHLLRL